MLSRTDRQLVEDQVIKATDEVATNYVESYLTVDDRITIRNRFYHPALFIKDSETGPDGTFKEMIPLMFTPEQVAKAAIVANKMKAEGELDDTIFLCVTNPSEAAAISKEQEELAVNNLVMEHYSTAQLFKLFLLSLLK